jgi:hypothetical protein
MKLPGDLGEIKRDTGIEEREGLAERGGFEPPIHLLSV